tara:strand:+ start:19938 stop:20693 length:756 start_codon:yes stop_codon:yes gene_type:complete
MVKNFINKIANIFGIEVNKINKKKLDFDKIYQIIFKNKNVVIFDVGANKGQSIKRFKKIFPSCEIHAFEPINIEYENLNKIFKDDTSIHINNLALGDKKETKELLIAKRTGVSSFYKLNKNTEWLKIRSKQYQVSEENFQNKTQKTNIITLDDYLENKKIKKIDILKIDTQGYEDKVLDGSKKSFQDDLISSVETEIMFDNVYEKYLSFSDIEKNLKNNFRFSGIKTYNNNLFEGINFFAEILYINKKLLK